MEKRTIAICFTFLLIVAILSGCSENNNELSEELSVDQIKTNFIHAINNVSSYKCNLTGKLNITLFKGAETNVTERLSNANFLINISNRTLEHDSEFLNIGEDEKDKMIIYIIGDFRYIGYGKEGNLTWDYEELSPFSAESKWNMSSPIEMFVEQITNVMPQQGNITWKRLNDESFNNHTFYILQSEYINNISDTTHAGYDLAEIYHTFWIDKTNYFLYKVELNQIRDITGYYAGEYDRRYLISEDIFTFYDYNIPVYIELPPDIIP